MADGATLSTGQLVGRKHPGEALSRELDARDWTQQDFALVLGRPVQFVSELIGGKKEITRESAAQIGAAIGPSPEYWLHLQDAYFLSKHQSQEEVQAELDDVRIRAKMNALAPLSVLRKRGIIRGRTTREQADEVKALFGIRDLDDEPPFLAAARRSNTTEAFTPTQKAWLACAQQKARSVQVPEFNATELEELAARISQQLVSEKDFARLPRLFAKVGVKLVYVESFPSSKIDAAAFLQGGSPVIALSGRGQRMDKVLFALLHEVAHILLGHLDENFLVLDELDSSRDAIEQAADAKAGELLLPEPLPRVPTRLSVDWINSTAATLGIHSILLIGRLQKLGKIPWRTALVRNAPNVSGQLQAW